MTGLPKWWLGTSHIILGRARNAGGYFDFDKIDANEPPDNIRELLHQLADFNLAGVRLKDPNLVNWIGELRDDCRWLLAWVEEKE